MSAKHILVVGVLVIALVGGLVVPVPVYSETIPVTEDFWTALIKALSLVQGKGEIKNFTFSYVTSGPDHSVQSIKIECDSLNIEESMIKEGDLATVDYSIDVRGLRVEVTGSAKIDLNLSSYSLCSMVKIRYTQDGLVLSAYAPAWRLMLSRIG